MIATLLVVEHADRAAELGDDDDERFVEKRLAGRQAGRRLQIGEQRAECGIELRALRVQRVHAVRRWGVDAAVVIPTAEGRLHETSSFVRPDEIAGDDQRIAECRAAVFRVIVGREAEGRVDVWRVHQRLRLIIEIVHVKRDLAARSRRAIAIELVQKAPAVAESHSAIRMIDRRQTCRCRHDLKWRVCRGEVSRLRNAG